MFFSLFKILRFAQNDNCHPEELAMTTVILRSLQ